MTFYEKIKELQILPVFYAFQETRLTPADLPFLLYLGEGQNQFLADNKIAYKNNIYRCEYYFTKKDIELEDQIEQFFIDNNIIYNKSEDIYIESESAFVIYYTNMEYIAYE